jgi:hypothetical protein
MQDPDVLAMPIPVFQRPLSQERDTTVVIILIPPFSIHLSFYLNPFSVKKY